MVLMTASPLYRSGSNLSGLSGVIDPKYGMVEVIYIFNPILKYGKKNQEHQEDR